MSFSDYKGNFIGLTNSLSCHVLIFFVKHLCHSCLTFSRHAVPVNWNEEISCQKYCCQILNQFYPVLWGIVCWLFKNVLFCFLSHELIDSCSRMEITHSVSLPNWTQHCWPGSLCESQLFRLSTPVQLPASAHVLVHQSTRLRPDCLCLIVVPGNNEIVGICCTAEQCQSQAKCPHTRLSGLL